MQLKRTRCHGALQRGQRTVLPGDMARSSRISSRHHRFQKVPRNVAGAVAVTVVACSTLLGATTARVGAGAQTTATFPAPSWIDVFGSVALSSPTVATVNGQPIVSVASQNSYLDLVDAETGNNLPSWPVPVDITPNSPTAVESSPIEDSPNRSDRTTIPLPNAPAVTPPWSMWRNRPTQTGVATSTFQVAGGPKLEQQRGEEELVTRSARVARWSSSGSDRAPCR